MDICALISSKVKSSSFLDIYILIYKNSISLNIYLLFRPHLRETHLKTYLYK